MFLSASFALISSMYTDAKICSREKGVNMQIAEQDST